MDVVQQLADRVSGRSRSWKARLVADRIPEGTSVLLVGVSDSRYFKSSNQLERFLAEKRQAVGLYYPPLEGIRQSLAFPLVRGDGLALPFRDESFDYVFSNAVVEHVGDQAAQARFIEESRRVARHGVVHTTPNRWFPVETHAKVLFRHWLPRRFHERLLTNRRYTWHSTDRLLSRRDFRALFASHARSWGWPANFPMTCIVEERKRTGPGP